MICVCKEYEVKIKLVQEKWLLRNMKIFLGYNKKLLFIGENEPLMKGGIKILWRIYLVGYE